MKPPWFKISVGLPEFMNTLKEKQIIGMCFSNCQSQSLHHSTIFATITET